MKGWDEDSDCLLAWGNVLDFLNHEVKEKDDEIGVRLKVLFDAR